MISSSFFIENLHCKLLRFFMIFRFIECSGNITPGTLHREHNEQNALQNRVIKLDDTAKIVPINLQIQSGSENGSKSKNLVIAPSVHQNDKPKVDLDGIVLMKKSRKKKKKKNKKKDKEKDREKAKSKKRKLRENENVNDQTKRRKVSPQQNSDPNASIKTDKLSEWERD